MQQISRYKKKKKNLEQKVVYLFLYNVDQHLDQNASLAF